MGTAGKALFGVAALASISSAVAIRSVKSAAWYRDNPVAKEWLEENHFSSREKVVDFDPNWNDSYFGLGCHRIIFGGKNFKKLYTESSLGTPSKDVSSKDQLPITDLLGDTSEPLVGCSTAYLKSGTGNKKVYQFELALRQGDKGFEERISVHEDKIISQLVFFEQEPQPDPTKKPTYKHLFGLYRYTKQNSEESGTKTYQVANPNVASGQSIWSDLDLSSSSNETTSRYYSVWIDDDRDGKGIFDDLGIKSNSKLFSSVAQNQNSESADVSDFFYVNQKDKDNNLQAPSGTIDHYKLSVLDSLTKRLHSRKGSWKSASTFCASLANFEDRLPLSEVKQLAQYCYEIKTPSKSTQS